MTNRELEILIRELAALPKECEWAEFKANNCHPQEIGEYISALSNSACYHKQAYIYLIYGIEKKNYPMASRIIADVLRQN